MLTFRKITIVLIGTAFVVGKAQLKESPRAKNARANQRKKV